MPVTCISVKPSRKQAEEFLRQRTSPRYLAIDEDLEQLRRVLSAWMHADLNPNILADVIDLQDQLAEVDAGTHPSIFRNRARTVDNTDEVRDRIEDNLNATVFLLLENAGVK